MKSKFPKLATILINPLCVRSVVSSWWPHGLRPTRLLCTWVFPGKNGGVTCHPLQILMLHKSLKQWSVWGLCSIPPPPPNTVKWAHSRGTEVRPSPGLKPCSIPSVWPWKIHLIMPWGWPNQEGKPKKRGYLCTHSWFTLPYSKNYYNIVRQLYSNKNFFKERKTHLGSLSLTFPTCEMGL